MTSFTDSKLNRRSLLVGTASLMALPLLPDMASAQASSATRGGVLRMIVDPEPSILCSLSSTSGGDIIVSGKMTEGLCWYDFDMNPQPQLAVEWSMTDDGKEYTFKLRPNVKWHDGKDFTSADVAISIDLLKRWHPRGRATFANVTEVRTPDPLTAVIVLSDPAPYLMNALAAVESPIVPHHIYAGLPQDANPATSPNALAPVGTGPYKVKEWSRSNYLTLVRNEDYWDKDKPYVDEIRMLFMPDASARAIAFETQEADLAGASSVGFAQVGRMEELPYIGIDYNGEIYNPKQTQIDFNLDHPILSNQKVRQAIVHAIDRNVIVQTVWYGQAVVSPTPISVLTTRFHAADAETYAFDTEAAERLLDEAGYPRKDGGMRFALTHDFIPYNAEAFQRQAEYIRQALRKVGIDVTIRSQDYASWIKRVYTDREFDFTANFASNSFDPTAGVQRLYWSKNFKIGIPFTNCTHYDNPQVDELLEKAAIEPDIEKRAELFKEFQRIVCREVPSMNVVTVKAYTIYNKKVHNHTVTADGVMGNLGDVYLA